MWQRKQPSKPRLPIVAIGVLMILGTALVVQNVHLRGPFYDPENSSDDHVYVTRGQYGWPMAFYVRWHVSFYGIPFAEEYDVIEKPVWSIRDARSWAVLVNIAFTALLLASTCAVVNRWRREQNRPFQFGLKGMFFGTAVVAIVMTLIEQQSLDAWILLNIPLAVGVVCLPAAVGIIMAERLHTVDRKRRHTRRRFQDAAP